jgi:hypothetical protein
MVQLEFHWNRILYQCPILGTRSTEITHQSFLTCLDHVYGWLLVVSPWYIAVYDVYDITVISPCLVILLIQHQWIPIISSLQYHSPEIPSDCQSSWQVAAQQDAQAKRDADWQRAGLEAVVAAVSVGKMWWSITDYQRASVPTHLGVSINRGTPKKLVGLWWKLLSKWFKMDDD